ncbi:unnamed protein product [Protopolystoma xenopodis]|uniref:Uncharacterized protein n=1 Tax=Protopolystoma xenopodis TaxID=117903 RepID=A0A3S5AGL2_9PLAT|nr:unnamed protein product [Protopolystoma xenopodis]
MPDHRVDGDVPRSTDIPGGKGIEIENIMREFIHTHGFKWYHIILFLFSVVSYITDVASDAYLTFTYFRQVSAVINVNILYCGPFEVFLKFKLSLDEDYCKAYDVSHLLGVFVFDFMTSVG